MGREPDGVRTVQPFVRFEGEYERPQPNVPHPSTKEGREHLFRAPANEGQDAIVVKEEDLEDLDDDDEQEDDEQKDEAPDTNGSEATTTKT